jgi:type II secretory pathway pseudopilin PulG
MEEIHGAFMNGVSIAGPASMPPSRHLTLVHNTPSARAMRHVRKRHGAMSLLEVMIGLAVLGFIATGVLAAFVQSRRLTEGSIRQNTAVTAAQGYIEQMKNMEFAQLALDPIPTLISQGTPDPLFVSPLPRSDATAVVNQRLLDMRNTPNQTDDDLPLEIVVWIEDLTDPGAGVAPAKLITMRYSWVVQTGIGSTRRVSNTISAIRSEVSTF